MEPSFKPSHWSKHTVQDCQMYHSEYNTHTKPGCLESHYYHFASSNPVFYGHTVARQTPPGASHRQTGREDESLPERPAELAGDGVRHRDGKHRAELQRSQLPVGEALHGHTRVREWSPSSNIWHLDIAVFDHPLLVCHRYPEQNAVSHHLVDVCVGAGPLPVRSLHLQNCSSDHRGHGTSHRGKFLYNGNADWIPVYSRNTRGSGNTAEET